VTRFGGTLARFAAQPATTGRAIVEFDLLVPEMEAVDLRPAVEEEQEDRPLEERPRLIGPVMALHS